MKNLDRVNRNLRRGAISTLILLGLMTGLSEGPGEPTSLHWADVVRLRFDSRRVVLERRGAPATVVSLLYANQPNEVREAICALVPVGALRGPHA